MIKAIALEIRIFIIVLETSFFFFVSYHWGNSYLKANVNFT